MAWAGTWGREVKAPVDLRRARSSGSSGRLQITKCAGFQAVTPSPHGAWLLRIGACAHGDVQMEGLRQPQWFRTTGAGEGSGPLWLSVFRAGPGSGLRSHHLELRRKGTILDTKKIVPTTE